MSRTRREFDEKYARLIWSPALIHIDSFRDDGYRRRFDLDYSDIIIGDPFLDASRGAAQIQGKTETQENSLMCRNSMLEQRIDR